MIKACLSLLAGMYALHFTSFESGSDLFIAALFIAGLLTVFAGGSSGLLFLAGLALFLLHAQRVIDVRLDERFEGDSIKTVVRVIDFPRTRDGAVSFIAEPIEDRRTPNRLRLTWFNAPSAPRIGDVWQLEVRLRRPRGASNPGVFDYEAWLFRKRIGATGYVVNGDRNVLERRDDSGPLSMFRERQVDRLIDTIGDRETAAVAAAISVGTRHLVSDKQWSRFATTGTTHLMAISGLHVGLASTSAYFLALLACALFRTGGNHVRVAYTCALITAIAYSTVSGLAVPAQRATLMLFFGIVVLLRNREIRSFSVLAATCAALTVIDPLDTMAHGFQLSFLAVLVLLWLGQRRASSAPAGRTGRVASSVQGLVSLQFGLLFGLMPAVIAAFGRISIAAPVANIVAIPLFSFVTVPFVLLGIAIEFPAPSVAEAALKVSAASIGLLDEILEQVSGLPYMALPIARPHGAAWVSLFLVASWVLIPPGWPGRHVAWLAFLVLPGHRIDGPAYGCVDMRMLDVGQGLAAIVRTNTRTMLYDTGPSFPGGSSAARRVLVPYFRSEGLTRLDRVVVSHSDADHAGGLDDLLAEITVGDVWVGESLQRDIARSRFCRRGDRWQWDGVVFEILHPPANHGYEGNDASCVLQVSAGNNRLLLTGDIGAAIELALLRDRLLEPALAIIVPHHGSDTSSTQALVDALAPRVALIPAGYRNRWNLPREKVVERWMHAGSDVFTTSNHGAIGISLCHDSGMGPVSAHRRNSHRLWHAPVER